jgi:hypothetical protein
LSRLRTGFVITGASAATTSAAASDGPDSPSPAQYSIAGMLKMNVPNSAEVGPV